MPEINFEIQNYGLVKFYIVSWGGKKNYFSYIDCFKYILAILIK